MVSSLEHPLSTNPIAAWMCTDPALGPPRAEISVATSQASSSPWTSISAVSTNIHSVTAARSWTSSSWPWCPYPNPATLFLSKYFPYVPLPLVPDGRRVGPSHQDHHDRLLNTLVSLRYDLNPEQSIGSLSDLITSFLMAPRDSSSARDKI